MKPLTKISDYDPTITINYYTRAMAGDGEGWHLSKDGVVETPLHLIEDADKRKKIMLEASSLVWPRSFNLELDLSKDWEDFLKKYDGLSAHAISNRLGLKGKGAIKLAKALYQYADYRRRESLSLAEGRLKDSGIFQRNAEIVYARDIRPVCYCW